MHFPQKTTSTMRTRLTTVTRLICLALSLTAVTAKKDAPAVEETGFKSLPANIFYFDDSDTVLVTVAVSGGYPTASRAGNEMRVPPPASAFTAPASTPAPARSALWNRFTRYRPTA